MRDGRRFGVQVGIAFLLLGAVLVWRDRMVVSAVTGSIGAMLLLGGLLTPRKLGPVHRRWMAGALLIAPVIHGDRVLPCVDTHGSANAGYGAQSAQR